MRYMKPQVNSKSQSRVIFQQDRSRQFAPRLQLLFQQPFCLSDNRNGIVSKFFRQNQPRDAVRGEPASRDPAHGDYLTLREYRSAKRRLTEHHHQLSVSVYPAARQNIPMNLAHPARHRAAVMALGFDDLDRLRLALSRNPPASLNHFPSPWARRLAGDQD